MQCSLKENSVGNVNFGQGSNTSLENQTAFLCKGALPACGSGAAGAKWLCECCEGKALGAVRCSGVAAMMGCMNTAVCAQAGTAASVLYFYQHKEEMGAQSDAVPQVRGRGFWSLTVRSGPLWPCLAHSSQPPQLCVCLALLTGVCPTRSAVSFFVHRLLSNSTGNCSNFLK